MEIVSFKQRITANLVCCAKEYSSLLGYDYFISSPDFKNRKRYLIRFYEGNFLHLTGVKTNVNAKDFYFLCLGGSIAEDMFDCSSTKELKGTVKEKFFALSSISSFFDKKLLFQESFIKGRIQCLLPAMGYAPLALMVENMRLTLKPFSTKTNSIPASA